MNASVEQSEITGTTEKETLTLVPVATVNEKTERGKKMKYMKTRTLEKNGLSPHYSAEMLPSNTRFPENCLCDNSLIGIWTKHM